MTSPYPIVCEPILMSKVWGGRRLAALGKKLPPEGSKDALIGESWELADLGATSASGGGGQAARSIIRNGPLAGKTINDALKLWGQDLLGQIKPTAGGNFPILIKFLDAKEHLSVQVHPSVAYCRSHPEAHLKTECWYIMAAEPGSVIFKGVKPGVTRADFERALREPGTQGAGVVALMESVPAVVGECHNLPSGTVHALGAGVLVAEVQTPSDTTFRVYDWAKEYGRAGRELHVEQSLKCIAWEQARDATRFGKGIGASTPHATRLVSTGFFEVDEVRLAKGERFALAEAGATPRPQVLMVLRGGANIATNAGATSAGATAMKLGETGLVPASVVAGCELIADEASTLLRAIVR